LWLVLSFVLAICTAPTTATIAGRAFVRSAYLTKMNYILRDYQIVGRDFLKARKFAMLGDAPGVGKTGQAIMAIDPAWRVLIVCPASVKLQWQRMFFDWRGWVSSIINTSEDEISRFPNITILNYDLMIREPLLSQLLKYRFDLIIYDEAHKLKSIDAKRTKIALSQKYLRPRADRIWFLTGTPIKNRTVDLYPILRSCAPEVLGPYASFLKFAYRYCGAYSGRFGLDTSGASHTEELRERLKPFMLRREKREVLTELPPRVVSKIDLDVRPRLKELLRKRRKKR
jgi:SNF2 family DNA or RNA helicase